MSRNSYAEGTMYMKLALAVLVLHQILLSPAKGDFIIQHLTETSGNCASPAQSGDTLYIHYNGTLASNGKPFDSSWGKEPYYFRLGAGHVIAGMEQGTSGMCPGDKRKLTIPPELAYGDEGAGEDIPGGATLVFEVQLVKIDHAQYVKFHTEETSEGNIRIEYLTDTSGNCENPAKSGDKLYIHYNGTLASNGKQFDSSWGKDLYWFTLGERYVIAGMEQGTTGMCPGDRRKLTIPPELAYGDGGYGDIIPPGSTLVFEVQLVEIEHGDQYSDVHPEELPLGDATSDCYDKHEKCGEWARSGECRKNPIWMRPNCMRACKQCSAVGGETDVTEECSKWAKDGECDVNFDWMFFNCPKACERTGKNLSAWRSEATHSTEL